MAATLIVSTKFHAMDVAGNDLAAGKVFTYSAGTLTPLATFTDQSGGSPNTNPVILDSTGRASIWLTPGVAYRIIVKDTNGVTMPDGDVDNITAPDVGFAAFVVQLATSVGATLVGWIQSGAGAVLRTISDKLRDRVSVFDFMTIAQIADVRTFAYTLDILAAIQAAHDSLPSGGGGLYFPQGGYKVSGALNITKPVTVYGAGFSSNIRTGSATANIFSVSNAQQVVIRDLYFNSSVVRTAGFYVDFASTTSRVRMSDFAMDGAIGGIQTAATATCTIERAQILNSVAATGVGIRVNAGFDVTIRDVLMDAGAQIFSGIYVTATGDLTIEDCNIIHGGQAVYLNPGAGQVITSVFANNSFFDTSSRGLFVNPNGAGATVARCMFDECWMSSHTLAGAQFLTAAGGVVDGVYFNNCEFFLNGTDGLTVSDTGVTNVHVRNGSAAQNVGSGFSFAANVSNFSVQGVRIGAGDGLTGNNVGITILAGTSSSYSLANNIFTGNVANAIVDGGTGTTKSVSKNIGYNPVANTAITVTASPFSYTNNSGETQNVYVTGGTVSSVTVDGKQVAAAGNIVAAVPQKAAMVVTYTVAPTMSASGY